MGKSRVLAIMGTNSCVVTTVEMETLAEVVQERVRGSVSPPPIAEQFSLPDWPKAMDKEVWLMVIFRVEAGRENIIVCLEMAKND